MVKIPYQPMAKPIIGAPPLDRAVSTNWLFKLPFLIIILLLLSDVVYFDNCVAGPLQGRCRAIARFLK